MCSHTITARFTTVLALVVAASSLSSAAYAECVTVSLLKDQGLEGPRNVEPAPALIFSGTVTATDLDKHTVSLRVDRVWKGELHRATTLFVAPVVEGAHAGAFVEGERYFVTANGPIVVFGLDDVTATELPAGTVGLAFGCTDGPVPFADAGERLKKLGRGRAPLP